MKAKIGIFMSLFVLLILSSSWAKEFQVETSEGFQAALTEAEENGEDDTIYLAAGTYYGGFRYSAPSTENYALTIKAEAGLKPEQVILDGSNSQRVLYLTDMYWHAGANFGLEGVTIRNGFESRGGAGLYAKSRSGAIVFTNNVITGNTVKHEGLTFGGGVYAYSPYGTITFSGNTITSNMVEASNATGGGICVDSDSGAIILINNLIAGNMLKGYGRGGGAYVAYNSGTVTLVSNTITRNTATLGGGCYAWYISSSACVYFYDNIIWRNTAEHDIYFYGNATSYGYNNNYHQLFGSWTYGGDNIDDDPLFVDPINHDYHLETGSPCIDTGNNDAPELPEKDKDEKPRIIDGDGNGEATIDMGAYEFGDICEGDFDDDRDIDGSDLAKLAADPDLLDLSTFAADFGRTDCPNKTVQEKNYAI